MAKITEPSHAWIYKKLGRHNNKKTRGKATIPYRDEVVLKGEVKTRLG